MENIHLKITFSDIQKYMKEHKKLVCNREALFVKYMRKTEELTYEKLDIIIDKYNWIHPSIERDDSELLENLIRFDDYLNMQSFDLDALYHILIPAIGFYQKSKQIRHVKTVLGAYDVASKLNIPNRDLQGLIFRDAIDDYIVSGQIKDFGSMYKGYSHLLIGKEKCRKELMAYEDIYGKSTVRKVRKLIKEREW